MLRAVSNADCYLWRLDYQSLLQALPRITEMKRMRVLQFGLSLLCLSLFLSTNPLLAETPPWNRFRGPDGKGTVESAGPPTEFGENRNVLWKTPIHGKGWSSPVVWDDQVWMTTATEDGTKLYAVCVDAKTGDIVHDLLVFEVAVPQDCHPTNSYASCTPYVEEGRVYVHFGSAGTACLDAQTGDTIWSRNDLPCDHFRGPASSPIVVGDLLIVQFDGIDLQYVVALNKNSGDNVWKTNRDIDYGTTEGDYKKAYGTPSVIEVEGQPQIICPAAVETIAYHPEDGKEIWRIRHGGMNASAAPIYEYGLVFLNVGHGDTSLVALRPPAEAGKQPKIVWSTGRSVPHKGSVIVSAGALYMFSDNGVATCLGARSGQKFWTERLGGEFWSSPVLAGKRIYCANKQGDVFVLQAGPELNVLAKNSFDDGFNATPAILEDSLLLRSFTHLYRIGEE